MPGRWLDYPALGCIGDAFNIAVFVVSVVDRELVVYHLGDVEREDGRVILLALVHGHWGFIASREGYCCPNWWFLVRATRPRLDTLRSHHALVDASTAALQLVGGADDAADDDEVGRDEFSEGSVSK